MTAPVAFVDTETTGLDPRRHEIWEVGLILPDGTERHWFLPVNEAKADPFALSIGRFHERHPWGRLCSDPAGIYDKHDFAVPSYFAQEFGRLTHGLHLAGAVVSFDEERLRKLLLANGKLPTWHYHLVDVEALAAGYIAGRYHDPTWAAPTDSADWVAPPWDSAALSHAVDVNPDDFDRHTALGDARWAKAIYEAVMG